MKQSISRSAWVLLCALGLSCTPATIIPIGGGDGGTGPGNSGDGGTGPSQCTNLQCQVVNCQGKGSGSTTLSGVVNIPAGNLPLYNASVYVPNGKLDTIVDGPSCNRCDTQLSGDPVVKTKTDVSGHFQLKDVPAGQNIPLVISLGKWRRQITIPSVPACAETALPAEMTRLPKNRTEGNIPRIALTTGGFDAIECLLRKLGLDDSEFTPEAGAGRVNLFAGHGGAQAYTQKLNGGASFTTASDMPGTTSGWWSSYDNLKLYDILVLSCEGQQYLDEKSMTARGNVQTFIDNGGRVFASHWHNVWIQDAPTPLSTVGTFYGSGQSQNFTTTITTDIDVSFDKGKALADWLVAVGASTKRGELPILNARSTVQSIDPKLTQRFVYYNDPAHQTPDAQYFSFNAPVGAAAGAQCGRMVFTDIHVSGNDANSPNPNLDISNPGHPFPNGCVTTDLSAQEKALIFLLFDLTDCIQPILG